MCIYVQSLAGCPQTNKTAEPPVPDTVLHGSREEDDLITRDTTIGLVVMGVLVICVGGVYARRRYVWKCASSAVRALLFSIL
jgi:hypothetical protein